MELQTVRTGVAAPWLLLAGLAWLVAVPRMSGMDMGPGTALGSFSFFAVTWTAMMASMMLPSALPAVASFDRVASRRRAATFAPLEFGASYVAVWAIVGIAAFAAYRGIRAADLGFVAWDRAGAGIAGAAVIAAGIYELTPLKRACLARCRANDYRNANGVDAGVRYAVNCVGCSIGLMLVLFALGVMSVVWMLLIAALVFAEKVPRVGASLVTPIALLLVGLGSWVALDASSVPWLTQPM